MESYDTRVGGPKHPASNERTNERSDRRDCKLSRHRENRQSNIAMPTIVESARQKRSEHTFNSSWTALQFNAATARTRTTYTSPLSLSSLSLSLSFSFYTLSFLSTSRSILIVPSSVVYPCNDLETRTGTWLFRSQRRLLHGSGLLPGKNYASIVRASSDIVKVVLCE